jgi:hypothetical protein
MSGEQPEVAVTVMLSKPIKAHGEEVTQLTFREPTPRDLMQLGFPSLIVPSADGGVSGIEVRAKVIGAYIARLAGIPPSSVEAMSVSDFIACQSEILPFFQ